MDHRKTTWRGKAAALLLALACVAATSSASARERGSVRAQLHVSVTVVSTCSVEARGSSDAVGVACRGATAAEPQVREADFVTADGLQRHTVATLNF